MLFHKARDVATLPGMKLSAQFANGVTKLYDVKSPVHRFPVFGSLLEGFLFEAIYVPESFEGQVPRSVIYDDLWYRTAYLGFGSRPDDLAVVADVDGKSPGYVLPLARVAGSAPP